ncbi:growth/differentiation factor 10b [Paralichthys olivaceus]|uniref:growth/differentiation factor 10b n=1 Tax=Paralichthys olivaceus TaxID=8255 RepID=UPI003752DED1
MTSIKLLPVFHFFLWIPVAWCVVEPPTKVTLHCHNLQNTLEWSYGRFLPGLRFRVDIRPYEGLPTQLWVDPPALQANLSSFSDPSNAYLVLVTAVVGQNESAADEEITFSYFHGSSSSQKCSVDLPPVNIVAQPDDNVLFHFMHPWLWYHPTEPNSPNSKLRKKKSSGRNDLPVFKYSVVVVGQARQHHFHCGKSECKQEIPVEASQEKHCLSITGELEKMAVESTELHCTMPSIPVPPDQNNYIVYIIVSVLGVCVVVFVVFLVYKKKTWPKIVIPGSMSIKRPMQGSMAVVPEQVVVLRVEPSSPTPLLSNEEEPMFTPSAPTIDSPVLRLRAVLKNAEDEPDEEEPLSDEGQGYLRGGSLDEDEPQDNIEAQHGYEKRPVLVKMGSDELVEAYRS